MTHGRLPVVTSCRDLRVSATQEEVSERQLQSAPTGKAKDNAAGVSYRSYSGDYLAGRLPDLMVT